MVLADVVFCFCCVVLWVLVVLGVLGFLWVVWFSRPCSQTRGGLVDARLKDGVFKGCL
jgi:hypothetical protein